MMNHSCPRPEYPRPRLERKDNWINLNGEWYFATDPGSSAEARKFYEQKTLAQRILVPFVPESRLSGIENIDFMRITRITTVIDNGCFVLR